MQARSALFDLYGDHLRARGGRAPVAALVRLLAPLGVAAPAVRTAISRMVRQGWLDPVRLPHGRGYALTAKAHRRLEEAAARVYRTARVGWAGAFDIVVISTALPRRDRQRLSRQLSFLGYGCLRDDVWVASRPGAGVDDLLADAGVAYQRFAAQHLAGTDGTPGVVRRAWDLPALAASYDRFVAEFAPLVTNVTSRTPARDAYAVRFRLVHAWRNFLFTDPQLPPALLPQPWAGTAAAAFFDRHAGRLRPAADRFVDDCLAEPAAHPGPGTGPDPGRSAAGGDASAPGRPRAPRGWPGPPGPTTLPGPHRLPGR